MSKVICDVCGTSYPDSSVQCPICGYVHSAEAQNVSDVQEDKTSSNSYTYVKGGRFSKSNVKKRNRGVKPAAVSAPKKNSKKQSKTNTGLIITIIVLLLAIVAVIAYIYIKFFMPPAPNAPEKPDFSGTQISDQVENNSPDQPQDDTADNNEILCTEILLDTYEIKLNEIGQTATLHTNLLPADTTDQLSFSSDAPNIITVDENGVVSAVGEGSAVITVKCGNVSVTCNVVCEVPEPEPVAELRLNRQQITFNKAGSSWVLYSGEIVASEIKWTTDDANVAIVSSGTVTAVGEGSTTVYAEYGGTKVSCQIVCDFASSDNGGQSGNGGVSEDVGQTGNGGVTEDAGESGSNQNASGEYHLDNLFSQFDTEVTLSVGESFPLRLVDSNGNSVNADWSVADSSICTVNNGDVTAVGSGETYVVATYYGKEYRCYIHVV